MMYKIREMNPEEYDELENFLYEAIYIPEDTPKPPRKILERPELQVYIENFGTRAADTCFVFEIDGKIVGACWARIMNDYGHIDNQTPSLALSVLKNFRRKGIAPALMNKLCSRLAEKNFNRVSLAVQKENLAAVKLYRRLNFEIIDERGEEFLMIKGLEV
ncbi:MAG: GNAT family N-acetyltransferase [Selenomonadaceae bacterium]|nr:GNAT family N-acetyltransferase [Selenomonadaceae bacterium]